MQFQQPFIIFLVSLSLLIACKSESEADKKIDEFYQDGIITPEEFNVIASLLRKNLRQAPAYRSDAAVQAYIENHAGSVSKKGANTITVADVPANQPAQTSSTVSNAGLKTPYTVFIENSGSMYGYSDGATTFKDAVYGFLSDILMPTRPITDKMGLNYINSVIVPIKEDSTTHKDQLEDFVSNLRPNSQAQKVGSRGQTDLSDVFKLALDSINKDKVVVLISDCIFSPGRNKIALDYLASQSTGIKRNFGDLLHKHADLTTLILKIKSEFNGTYYDFNNDTHPLKAVERPFYIWVVGKNAAIQTLLKQIDVDKIKGLQNRHSFAPTTVAAEPNWRIILNNRAGKFELDRNNSKAALINARVADRGKDMGIFRFSVNINLKGLGMPEAYLKDASNYMLSHNTYKMEIKELAADEQVAGFTHQFVLSTIDLQPIDLEISLQRTLPKWVEETNSMDDRNQTETELNKTFGFNYLIKGVSEAYASLNSDPKSVNNLFKIKISIKK